jgi:hypothetical protein
MLELPEEQARDAFMNSLFGSGEDLTRVRKGPKGTVSVWSLEVGRLFLRTHRV